MAAGTTVARINTIVTANTTQFTASMAKAETRAGKFTAAAGAAAKAASGPLTMGLLAVGGAAVKAAVGFDDSMTKIESLVGIAGDEVDAMKDSVRALSGQTAQAPVKLADAMFFIQSAGLRGATAMETLEASAKAAAVGLGEVEEIADLATSALNAYGEENISAVQATDVLTAAVREGKLEASELAGSMGRVLPIASAMGVRFDEVGAAFAALSRTGTNAAEAATQVRGILSSLLRPTQQAEEALTGMGLSSEGLRQQIKDEGLLATLQTLAEEFDGNAAASASVFGNVRALSGVMDLMGANVATTEQIFASMRDTTGTLDQAFGIVSETAGFTFQQAMADLQETLVGIGEAVLPIVLTMLDGARTMVEAFSAMPKPLKMAAAAMAAFVVASGPIGQIALAVGGLMYVVGKLGEESRMAKDRQEALTEEFIAAGDPASTMIDQMREMADAIEDVGDEADAAANPIGDFVGSNLALVMALDNEVLPQFQALGMSMDDVAQVAENGTDAFQDLQDVVKGTGNIDSLRMSIHDLTGAEREMAEAMIDAFEAGEITRGQLIVMTDVVDETADAFDDHREALEKDAEAFMKSADAAKLLNNVNLDAEKILADLAESGKTYAEQAEVIHGLTDDVTGSMDRMNFQAQMTGGTVGDLGDAADETADDADTLTGALEEASAEAETLRVTFEELMGVIVSESRALNDADLLLQAMDETFADLTNKSDELTATLPDARDALLTMAEDSAASLDQLFESGMKVGSPEMMAHALDYVDQMDRLQGIAKLNTDEFNAMREAILSMAGINIPVQITVQSNVPTSVAGFNPVVQQGGVFYGATGGIVTRPTMAMIGEAGPEAVVPLNQAPGASPLNGGLNGGGAVNVTVNMPPGSDGADVVRSLQEYARSHGGVVPILTGQL